MNVLFFKKRCTKWVDRGVDEAGEYSANEGPG